MGWHFVIRQKWQQPIGCRCGVVVALDWSGSPLIAAERMRPLSASISLTTMCHLAVTSGLPRWLPQAAAFRHRATSLRSMIICFAEGGFV
jgi:hypothetical protein